MKTILRFGLIIVLGLFIVLITLITPQPGHADSGFIGRSGTHFTLNGSPFYVAGANNHYLSWGSQAEVDNVLNDAADMHLNVIRTFMGPVRGSLDGTTPTIWKWDLNADSSNLNTNNVYVMYWDSATNQMAFNDGSNGIQKMDYVIAKARSLNIKVLISFLDFWEYTGGAQQIRAWYSPGDPLLENTDPKATPPYQDFLQDKDRYTAIFLDPQIKQAYKDWIKHVVEHVNTLDGLAYKDDPTIFAWDLMNEPQAKTVQMAQDWISEMATYTKSVDPNHLIASGTEGFYGGQAGSNPDTELRIPSIDFGVWHIYPAHHNKTPDEVRALITQHCDTGIGAGKPVLMEEFGYGSQNADQADVYQSWTDTLNNNNDCGGWLFWRLTSRQDSGDYPADRHDHFDIHDDGSPAAQVFKAAAIESEQRNNVATPGQ